MTTIVISKGEKVTVRTQQYECGLYVAFYREGDPIPLQCTSTKKEKAYHKFLRKKNEWIEEGSTKLLGRSKAA